MQRTCKSFHLYFVSNFAIWLRTTVRQTLCQLHEFQTSLENCLSKAFLYTLYDECLCHATHLCWAAAKCTTGEVLISGEIWMWNLIGWRLRVASSFCALHFDSQVMQCCAGLFMAKLWWPTTVTAKPKTSRQNQKRHSKTENQKPHGKNKIPHGKTKNLTAKPNTSQQKQNSFGFDVGICFWGEVFGFCCEVFGFAVRSLVLPWEFWFCREVFCFCREVFGFVVRYFVFAVRFLVLPWQLWVTVQSRLKLVIWSCGPLKHYLNSGTPNK